MCRSGAAAGWVVLLGFGLVGRATAAEVQLVALTPDARDEQPAQIFLGSSANGWDPRGSKLERVAPGVYSGTVVAEPGPLEFKFTRDGTWATVEKLADGAERTNRSATIEDGALEQVVVCRIARWADRPPPTQRRLIMQLEAPGGAAPRGPTLTGTIRYHHAFESPQLENERTLIVYLPPGYDEEQDRRYPVLYLHDGNNVFDASTSFAGAEWHADETAEHLIRAGVIDPVILVGIYNNPQRADEYTPWRDTGRGAGGAGDAYLGFVVHTVKPFIDRTYRTRPDRDHTFIAGSSLGGLISLYAAWKYPDVFGGAGVFSPALWWADRAMLGWVRANKPVNPGKLWISAGTEEGDAATPAGVRQYVRDCRELVGGLETQGLRRGGDFRYVEVEGGRHHESDWARQFGEMLKFLVGRSP